MTEREFSSGGIVLKEEKKGVSILLIKDSYGRWAWPKGKIDKGEKAASAALREVKEETGLEGLDLIGELGRTEYFYKREGKLIFKTVFFYLMLLKGRSELKIQRDEIQDGRWLDVKSAQKLLNYKGARELLENALSMYREHQNRK